MSSRILSKWGTPQTCKLLWTFKDHEISWVTSPISTTDSTVLGLGLRTTETTHRSCQLTGMQSLPSKEREECGIRRSIYILIKQTRDWSTSCCMLPYSEADLFERTKVGPETLLKRDEAEFGNWCNATRWIGFSECVNERLEEKKLHLKQNPHYFCEEYTKGTSTETLPLSKSTRRLTTVFLCKS